MCKLLDETYNKDYYIKAVIGCCKCYLYLNEKYIYIYIDIDIIIK